MITCITCKIQKDDTEFTIANSKFVYRKRKCRQCKIEYKKNHRIKNLEHYRTLAFNAKLRDRYNLTREQYDSLEKKCKICYSTNDLCIDHSHQNGKVRGILCRKCNTGIGLFGDNPLMLEVASLYLHGVL